MAGVAACALACAGAATADNYQFKLVTADQAVAKHVVLARVDLPGLSRWSGGTVKPDESPDNTRCSNYRLPKESDLTVTGDAETKYTFIGSSLDTHVQVFETAAMVETDWRRNAPRSGFLACVHEILAHRLGKDQRLDSVTKLTFPRVGNHVIALRVLVEAAPTGRRPVRILVDIVEFSRGRTEVNVVFSAPDALSGDPGALKAADVRIARILNAKTPSG